MQSGTALGTVNVTEPAGIDPNVLTAYVASESVQDARGRCLCSEKARCLVYVNGSPGGSGSLAEQQTLCWVY